MHKLEVSVNTLKLGLGITLAPVRVTAQPGQESKNYECATVRKIGLRMRRITTFVDTLVFV